MTGLMLREALVRELEGDLKDFMLKKKGGGMSPPVIFRQHLPLPIPPKVKPRGKEKEIEIPETYGREDIERNFPCVIVQLLDGSYGQERKMATAKVRILAGIFDDSLDAHGDTDVCNVLDRVAMLLLEKQVVDRRFSLKLPLKWSLFLEQPWPVYFGELETSWTFKGIERIYDRKEADITDGAYPDKKDRGR